MGKLLVVVAIVMVIAGLWITRNENGKVSLQLPQMPVGYVAMDPAKFGVQEYVKGLDKPTRLKFTPDGKYLLVALENGKVMVVNPDKTTKLLTKVDSGLVDLVFSSRYVVNGKMFLLYGNHIASTVLSDGSASRPQIIATTDQPVLGGVGVEVALQPHVVYLTAAQMMVVSEDGTDARAVVTGFVGGQAMARNLFENEGRFIFTDGNRLVYTKLVDIRGRVLQPVDLTNEKMVLTHLDEGANIVELEFHPGGMGPIKRAIAQENNVVAAVSGKNEIWLGRLSAISSQPKLVWETIVTRNPAAAGKGAVLTGMAVDSTTGAIYFCDKNEGKIYKIDLKG